MKLIIAASLLAGAAAFAPASQTATSTTLKASPFEGEVGAQPPLGFFDPLGITNGVDQETFDRLRYTEVKHGRIAMMAVVGYLTTMSGARFPGLEDVPAGFGAWAALPSSWLIWTVFTGASLEIMMRDASGYGGFEGPAEFPGDFRNGYIDFGWDKLDDATKLRKRSIELNNGRAAQMGILGLMVHEQLGASILPGGVLP
jgi:hypothetical protein